MHNVLKEIKSFHGETSSRWLSRDTYLFSRTLCISINYFYTLSRCEIGIGLEIDPDTAGINLPCDESRLTVVVEMQNDFREHRCVHGETSP